MASASGAGSAASLRVWGEVAPAGADGGALLGVMVAARLAGAAVPKPQPLAAAPDAALAAGGTTAGGRSAPVLELPAGAAAVPVGGGACFVAGGRTVARTLAALGCCRASDAGDADDHDDASAAGARALLRGGAAQSGAVAAAAAATVAAEAQVGAWVEWCDAEVGPAAAAWLLPVVGAVPESSEATARAKADVRAALGVLEAHLGGAAESVEGGVVPSSASSAAASAASAAAGAVFLTGGSLPSLADVAVAVTLQPLFQLVLDPAFRKPFAAVERWFRGMISLPAYREALEACGLPPDVVLCETAATAPRSEEPVEVVAAAPAPVAVAAPKKPPFDMAAWKSRHAEASDVRAEALPFFWDTFNAAEASIWHGEFDARAASEMDPEAGAAALEAWATRVGDALGDARAEVFGALAVLTSAGREGEGAPAKVELSCCWIFPGKEPPKPFLALEDDLKQWGFILLDVRDAACRGVVNDHFAQQGKFGGRAFVSGRVFA